MAPDIAIVGGAGHAGLPLALLLVNRGFRVRICDPNEAALAQIREGRMPFSEEGAQPLLQAALERERLSWSPRPDGIAGAAVVIVTIGTPIDRYLNPDLRVIKQWSEDSAPYLAHNPLLLLRSTVYPGTTNWLDGFLKQRGLNVRLAFCPERIAQGQAIRELQQLPQIVGGVTTQAAAEAGDLFRKLAPEVIELSPLEAEFAKLFANAYRYIHFAVVNQFYMLATEHGADFGKIIRACRHHYPRMASLPDAGFAAGPCLLKDTMQLFAFSDSHFSLGRDAMLVNEGLPGFLVQMARRHVDLSRSTAGILGMAFKAESDDIRDSLSFRLKKVLEMSARHVLCTDPYVKDPKLASLEQVLAEADVLFVATPHRVYRTLKIPSRTHVVDVWNCLDQNHKPSS